MASGRCENQNDKPSDVFRKYHHRLCRLLHLHKQTFQSFVVAAFAKIIIDMDTKAAILDKSRYLGADTLLDHIEIKIGADPGLFTTVFEIMEQLEDLKSIAEEMKKEVCRIEKQHLEQGKFRFRHNYVPTQSYVRSFLISNSTFWSNNKKKLVKIMNNFRKVYKCV